MACEACIETSIGPSINTHDGQEKTLDPFLLPQIHESLTTLNEAFSEGDSTQFESALIVLLDHCAELVNRGEYQQWW